MTQPTTVVPRSEPLRPLTLRGVGMTHRGNIRAENEDAILTDPAGRIWAVADGMGGHEGGAMAADIVIDALAGLPDHADDPQSALADALSLANTQVRAAAAARGGATMGATVVALCGDAGIGHVVWAGDSRAYLLRGDRLRRLTRDHSLVQALIDQGEIPAEGAEKHPQANVITRAVGAVDELEVDHVTVPFYPRDRILLCSDGLMRCVDDPVIEVLLRDAPSVQEACEALLRATLDGGAPDNVSVIVVEVALEEGIEGRVGGG